MKILWISPRWPFPSDDGAKQATAALALALAELGHEISFLTFAREARLAPSPNSRISLFAHYQAGSLSFLSRAASALGNLASSLPVSAAPFTGFGLSWERIRAGLGFDPAAVVFDGAHGFASFSGTQCPWPVVYRAHNNETSLWKQAADKSALSPYFGIQARRMHRLESELGNLSRGIAAISTADSASFREWFPGKAVKWVPMGFSFSPPAPMPLPPLSFGYLGRMDWPPNREGLIWFLEKVWPRVRERRADIKLRIAGSGDARWLDRYREFSFEWLGRINSPRAFYESIHASLAPVHFGSGTKIKLVEAVSNGRTVFATPAALAGSGMSGAALGVLSDSPDAWVEAMTEATLGDLAKKGQLVFDEARGLFGAKTAAETFLSLLGGSGA
ncbi:MAG: glycosyltransferase [Bdellovibrionota bacterium]